MILQKMKDVPEGYRVVPITHSLPFWESLIVEKHDNIATYLSPEWDLRLMLMFHNDSQCIVIPRVRTEH